MWPIGTYSRFLRKIKGQEGFERTEKVNYFGVLFCDVRQSKSREYILNYLDIFNQKSGKYIDFYIPGYIPSEEFYENNDPVDKIEVGEKIFIFSRKEYLDFCNSFSSDFGMDFPFSATLVLLEYRFGNFSTARKIVLELEAAEDGIKSSGNLFLTIFKCAEAGEMAKTLDDLFYRLTEHERTGIFAAAAKSVLNFLGVDLEPVLDQCKKIYKFRVQ